MDGLKNTLLIFGVSAFLMGCSVPEMDLESGSGLRARIYQTYLAIDEGDCKSAIDLITPVYQSKHSNNEVRMAYASAHGCNAGVNFFDLINELLDTDLTSSEFWIVLTRVFPSTHQDSKAESAIFAGDALFAMLKPGTVLGPSFTFNPGSYNVGSLRVTDRLDEANTLALFNSMAIIGALQNRYGDPDPATYRKRQNLGVSPGAPDGWAHADNVDEDACAYAGAIVTLFDSIGAVSDQLIDEASGATGTIQDTFLTSINAACAAGCDGTLALVTGCSLGPGTCASCPLELRGRTSCEGTTTDEASCAAAGIINFINSAPIGWPN